MLFQLVDQVQVQLDLLKTGRHVCVRKEPTPCRAVRRHERVTKTVNAVSALFACQWTTNIVPVTVLPSSTYSALTEAISKMLFSVLQEGHARMSGLPSQLNVPAQGSTTMLCDTLMLFLSGTTFRCALSRCFPVAHEMFRTSVKPPRTTS